MNQKVSEISTRLRDVLFGAISLVLIGFMIVGMMTTLGWMLNGS